MRTKPGSIIRSCNGYSFERAKSLGHYPLSNGHLVYMTYVGSNAFVVKKIITENGRPVAVTNGGGYFPSWILVTP